MADERLNLTAFSNAEIAKLQALKGKPLEDYPSHIERSVYTRSQIKNQVDLGARDPRIEPELASRVLGDEFIGISIEPDGQYLLIPNHPESDLDVDNYRRVQAEVERIKHESDEASRGGHPLQG